MTMRACTALLLLFAVACPPAATRGRFMHRIGSTPAGKHVDVYQDPTYSASERAELTADFLARAMRSSSYFQDDDIRPLAGYVVIGLSQVGHDQHLVVSGGEGIDPPSFHFFVEGDELNIVRYRGGVEQARHSAVIPTETVAVDLPDRPPPRQPPPVAETKPDPPPVVVATAPPVTQPPPVVTPPEPAAKPKKDKGKKKGTCAAPKDGKRLPPEEIRTKLAELERLKEKQLISEDEYACKRKELLDQL